MSPSSRRLDGECSCPCCNGPSGSNEATFAALRLGSPNRKGAQRVPNQTRLPLVSKTRNYCHSQSGQARHQCPALFKQHESLLLTQHRFTNARGVIIHTVLLYGGSTTTTTTIAAAATITTTSTTKHNYFIGPEHFDELMIYAARSNSLVNLRGPSSANLSGMIQCVLEEVPKWSGLARISIDEVIGIEMEKPMDLETYLLGIVTEIAYEIMELF
ncbi:unnamed protein product [Cochlearia groenlandica]